VNHGIAFKYGISLNLTVHASSVRINPIVNEFLRSAVFGRCKSDAMHRKVRIEMLYDILNEIEVSRKFVNVNMSVVPAA
jgi:hypothetical protein